MTDAAPPPSNQPSEGRVVAVVLAVAAAWIASGVTFGYPGVIIPALLAVPLVFVGFVLLSRG